MLLYLLLTWFFENGRRTSPCAVHASISPGLKGFETPLDTKVLRLAFKKLHCLNLEIDDLDDVCFWYAEKIPISDDLFPSTPSPMRSPMRRQ